MLVLTLLLTLLMLFSHTFLTLNRSSVIRDTTLVGVPRTVARIDGLILIVV